MYATEGFSGGGIADFFLNLFNPGREQAQEYASNVADQQLSDAAAAQAKSIHAILLNLQAQKAAGNTYSAEQYLIAYNTAVAAYNNLVGQLQQIEGPNSTWLYLSALPDLASAGLDQAVQDALDKLKAALKGIGLYVLLPVIGLALALIWVAGKSGAVQVRKVV